MRIPSGKSGNYGTPAAIGAGFAFALFLLALAMQWSDSPEVSAGTIDATLKGRMAAAGSGDLVPVILVFPDDPALRPSVAGKPRIMRRQGMISGLRRAAEATQQTALPQLQQHVRAGRATRMRPLWLINAVALDATPETIRQLAAQFPEARIIENAPVSVPLVPQAGGGGGGVAPEGWNLTEVNAAPVWAMGYTGGEVVVATTDTGVDPRHPDLVPSRYRAGARGWCDTTGTGAGPCPGSPVPADHPSSSAYSGHGTGVMGTILGHAASGQGIGLAPDASWAAARIINANGTSDVAAALGALQWLLETTPPDVINMSWSLQSTVEPGKSCNTYTDLQVAMQNLRAAGVVLVASAGNDGKPHLPAGYPEVIAVGATNPQGALWNFAGQSSGQGPTTCAGRPQYPDVVAPGQEVYTATFSNGGVANYQYFNGTSIAAAHVTGAVALLLSAFPDLTVDEVEAALALTAIPLDGGATPNNQYGFGLIDITAAFNQLLAGNAGWGLAPKVARVPDLWLAETGTGVSVRWDAVPGRGAGIAYAVSRNGFALGTTTGLELTDSGRAFGPGDIYTVEAVDGGNPSLRSAPAEAMPGDVNRGAVATDGRVDAFDLVSLTTAMTSPSPHPRFDLNGDGVLDGADRLLLESLFGSKRGLP
ncbi:MAG: S8 family serine peptidase [Nitrospirota bacterium]|nr:S8 family serine peptidase [Nitrospirota bacterium]